MFHKITGAALCGVFLAMTPAALLAQYPSGVPHGVTSYPSDGEIVHEGEVVDGGVVHGGIVHAGIGHAGVVAGGPAAAVASEAVREMLNPHGYWPQYSAGAWHGHHYHTEWGRPVAMVVPPTAGRQTKWSWGVANTTSTPIYHQYGRQYPGAGPHLAPGSGFRPTPYWPSHTDQFGVYYVRGPW